MRWVRGTGAAELDTKELDNHGWLMVVGRVVAASVNEDCIDENGWAILDKLHPLTIAVKPIRAIIDFALSPPTR
jgi:hypothetical protein